MLTNKYSYIRLEPSDNGGAILSYDEKEAGNGHDHCYGVSKKETYTKSEIGEAVKKMFSMVGVMVEVSESEDEEKVVVNVKG